MARATILLIMVALIAGMAGCGGSGITEYNLTIDSTAGGSVTYPGEGAFTYQEGEVVNLVAEAEEGYQFVNWTGDVDPIADVEAASTTIIMNDAHSITANFVAVYDLTIFSTTGGTVTTPSEGTFIYEEGEIVDLAAEAEQGYRFVNWSGDVGTIADSNAAITTITMSGHYDIIANFAQQYIIQVSAGCWHTTGVNSGGAVVVAGDNEFGQCDVGGWTDIRQVVAGNRHTVGLKEDGTVVAVGWSEYGQCNVSGWTDITQVAAGERHTVGLKSDGTVLAVGDNSYGQCNVDGWTDITQVAAGYYHTVGLMSDGTIVAAGYNCCGQCDIGNWMGILQVAAGYYHTVGLKSDGSVIAVGRNSDGQCNVGRWTDIAQVAAGEGHTVGLVSDGTVVAVGLDSYEQCGVGNWTDITQIAAGCYHTVGVGAYGEVFAMGRNDSGQCNVGGWNVKGTACSPDSDEALVWTPGALYKAAKAEDKWTLTDLKDGDKLVTNVQKVEYLPAGKGVLIVTSGTTYWYLKGGILLKVEGNSVPWVKGIACCPSGEVALLWTADALYEYVKVPGMWPHVGEVKNGNNPVRSVSKVEYLRDRSGAFIVASGKAYWYVTGGGDPIELKVGGKQPVSGVNGIACSPDSGEALVWTAGALYKAAKAEDKWTLTDLKDGDELVRNVRKVEYLSGGKGALIVTSSTTSGKAYWYVKGGDPIELKVGGNQAVKGVREIACSPDGGEALVWTAGALYKASKAEDKWTLTDLKDGNKLVRNVQKVEYLPDGKEALIATWTYGEFGKTYLYAKPDGLKKELTVESKSVGVLQGIACSPDSGEALVWTKDALYRYNQAENTLIFLQSVAGVTKVEYSLNGSGAFVVASSKTYWYVKSDGLTELSIPPSSK